MLRVTQNKPKMSDLVSKLGFGVNRRVNNILLYKKLSDEQLRQSQELVQDLNRDSNLKSYAEQKIRDG